MKLPAGIRNSWALLQASRSMPRFGMIMISALMMAGLKTPSSRKRRTRFWHSGAPRQMMCADAVKGYITI